MRSLALLLSLTGMALPGFAAQRLTVTQLEQMLGRIQGKSDAEVARQLSGIQLSERLSSARLLQLNADAPGDKSRQALLVLADVSSFLEPPPSGIPGTATPNLAAQRRMMARTVDYLAKSLPLLPNLFATRDTMRFESPAQPPDSAGTEEGVALHPVARSSVIVFYRDNREFVDAGKPKDGKAQPPDRGLTTWGEFGSILGIVTIDAAHSRIAWSHWELGAGGPEAVFHYAVPREKSHYDVKFCCVASAYGLENNLINQRAGYHGEITVDPSTGAVLRLTLEADPVPDAPIARASMVVEYAPVEIGDRTYICPVRSVALALAPDAKALQNALFPGGGAGGLPPLEKASLTTLPRVAQRTLLNDVSFRQYHLYRVESRVITGEAGKAETLAAANPAPSAGENAANAQPPAEPVVQPDMATARPSDEAAAPMPAAAVAAAPLEPAAAAPTPSELESAIPEVSVAMAAGLPQAPALARPSATNNGFTLRINSHLVDIGVVALDKKGRPVTDLKPEDFEIYDNGVKQELRTFEQAGTAHAPASAASAAAPRQPEFSNRPPAPGKAGAGETNTIVLLMDGGNMAFVDLANAREQTVRFLKALPGDTPVALYSMTKYGFAPLMESTLDHGSVAARLAKWMPTASDLSEAQFNEARNRQTLETVHSPEDLLSVNGNFTTDTTTQTEALDAKLRPLGSNPPRGALSVLVEVARHLAAVSGHKSLVWVTSDNALADWDQSSISIEKNSKYIQPAALRVQEAMNNAHVSVYPLDSSHLEGNVIEADVGRRNVELTPTFQEPPTLEVAKEGPEMTAGQDIDIYDEGRDLRPGRLTAQMQQDMRPIQGVFREIAQATGGEALRRSNDIVGQLNGVVNDGRATYLLDFAPSEQPDGKYHLLTVKVVDHKDVRLRYRTGFQYDQEPTAMNDLFRKAVWQPEDITDIAFSATPSTGDATKLELNISATDLALAQEGDLWTDKVDVFLVRRDDSSLHAQVTGQTLGLRLKSATYQKFLRDGIPFDQVVEQKQGITSLRIIVVDENSGRMGSVTIPAAVMLAKR